MSSRTTAARVLTVEDDPIVRADLRLVLEDAGFEVCADARDGAEAVELARAHRPDLILIDLGLPKVDGAEATRLILSERSVPVVALTGHRTGGLLERALDAGATAHVLKPFGVAELIGALTGALAHHAEHIEEQDSSRTSLVTKCYKEDSGYAWDYDFGTPVAFSSWVRVLFGR